MARHFKIHDLLDSQQLRDLESLAREPGNTIDQIEQWLAERCFVVSRGAVWAWRTDFLAGDRMTASLEVARSMLAAAKNGDVAALSDAAGLQLQQMVYEQLLNMQTNGVIETKELWAASMAMKNVVQSQRHVEKLREEIKARFDAEIDGAKKKNPGGVITAADIARASEAIFGK